MPVSIALPFASVASAFGNSNVAGQVIVLLLVAGSILAWTVMITKYRELRHARLMSVRFLDGYHRETHPASLLLKRQRFVGSPMYVVYEKTCGALGSALEASGAKPDDLFMGSVGAGQRQLSPVQTAGVRNVAERTMADEVVNLENRMGILATSVTSAPLLGLLGTVWGLMDSFGAMIEGGSTVMLSVVAPGISGALLTTVVGLLVALPSAIGYNILTDQIRRLAVDMDNFTQELMSDVERHYLP